MARFFVDPSQIINIRKNISPRENNKNLSAGTSVRSDDATEVRDMCAEIHITGSDVNHIKNVLRMRIGDEISVSDGCGTDYHCIISAISSDEIVAAVESSWASYSELPVKLYLFQALPKSDKMELVVQKAVELGATEIIPVATSRAVVKLDAKRAEKKGRALAADCREQRQAVRARHRARGTRCNFI